MSRQVAVQIAYALGIGLLIGLERTFQVVREDGSAAEGDPAERDAAKSDAAKSDAAKSDTESAATDGDESAAKSSSDASADERDDSDKPAAKAAKSQAEEEPPDNDQLGVRTFTILSLAGYAGALANEQLAFVAPVVLFGAIALVVSMYFRMAHGGIGITTEVAAVGTCVLGMLCLHNHSIAAVIALCVTILLASKKFTYDTVGKMRRVELEDTLKFLAVILMLLPLLPNRALDPYGAVNPYKIGLLVILISGIGYVGYFLTRILGAQKGLGITGVIGGLTSSTAVTAAMAAQAREHDELREICAFSTIAANATMFGRVLVVVAVLDMPLAKILALPIGTMLATAAVATVALWIRARNQVTSEEDKPTVQLKNPFSLGPALKFAGFFVMILFVLELAKRYLGNSGLYAAAALSGLADVDAIMLSVSEQTASSHMVRHVGSVVITIAVVSNSITKSGIALYSGGWKFGRLVGACLIGATGLGLLVAVLV